jgi:hypothetical protein
VTRIYLRRLGEPVLPTSRDTTAEDDTIDEGGSFLTHVWAEKNARKLAIFLLMNVSFMFAEVVYGWWTNSLGDFPTCAKSLFMHCVLPNATDYTLALYACCRALIGCVPHAV